MNSFLFKSLTGYRETDIITHKQLHGRLGHINLKTREMITNVHLLKVNDLSDIFCEACGKQHWLLFKKSLTRSENKVYSSWCDSIPLPSVRGVQYLITFLDASNSFLIVYFLEQKSEALQAFKQMIERKFDSYVKILPTGNGKEYLNDFYTYTTEKDIEYEHTAMYTTKHNRSETARRTIMDPYFKPGILQLWTKAVKHPFIWLTRSVNQNLFLKFGWIQNQI